MAAYRVQNLREYLAGHWKLVRTVTDERRGIRGKLHGSATFVPADDGLDFVENGWFRFGTFSGPVYRNYRYVFPADARAEVRFPDGTHLCHVDLSTGSCEAEHLCGNDRYRGFFLAVSANRLDMEWKIRGPAKNALIKSRYFRSD